MQQNAADIDIILKTYLNKFWLMYVNLHTMI